MRGIALVAVVAFAGLLRFEGLAWDDGILPHPDERYLTMVASALHAGKLTPAGRDDTERAAHRAGCVARNPATAGVGGWFDTACSDFNPANVGHAGYPYGQLPLATVRLAAEVLAAATGERTLREYGGIHLVGRALSAVADLLTLLVTFQLGRLLWGRAVGLLAAAFYAVAVLPIQAAHFFTVDSWVTLFASVALLFAVRLARFGHRADALAFGAAYGLALAAKISIAPLALLLPLAALWAPHRVAFAGRPDRITRVAVRLPEIALAAVAALVTFRFAAPYAFAGPAWHDLLPAPGFVDAVLESRRLASGEVDIPPNWQWLGRTAWLWPAQNLVVWGLGLPLGLAAVAGLCCRGWRLVRATPVERARALAWLWAVGMFIWLGQQWVASMRYFLPLYPVACLFAAGWLLPWWRTGRIARGRGAGSRLGWRGLAPATLVAVVLLGTVAWAFACHRIHTTLHPYAAATAWVLRNVPAPVSADLATAAGTPTLVNWPAAGEFRTGAPARVAATTVAPASGRIDALRLHRLLPAEGDGVVRLALRVIDSDGRELAATAAVELAVEPGAAAVRRDVVLPLQPAITLVGGRSYRLAVDVLQGAFTLSGAKIAHEGAWNDSLPTRMRWPAAAATLDLAGPSGRVPRDAGGVDPFAAGYYVPVDLALATEDDAAKRRRLSQGLAEAEWLIVPNRRFYDAMPRNPARFPLTTWFYDALFAGELGFARTLTIASLPRLFGIAFDDQALPAEGPGLASGRNTMWAAEEAFSVYDHPTVFVFRRTDDAARRVPAALEGSPAQLLTVGEALAATPPALAGRLGWSTRAAAVAPDALLQRADPARAVSLPGAAGGERSSWAASVAIAGWYAVTLLLAWLAWPWLALLWPALADRGYGVARIAGLAAVAASSWWASSLGWPLWSQAGLAVVVGAALAATLAVGWRCRLRLRALLRDHGADIATIEALYAALFALGLALRAVDPDLWAPAFGGEKPMDYAYFNSVLAAPAFPPPDPWFSGGRMNYYYFGWVLAAVPTKLLGTAAGLAYNLALATWLALTGTAAYALAANAVRPSLPVWAGRVAGGVALTAAVLLGNLDLPRTLAVNVAAVGELATRAQPADAGAWREALTRQAERWYWAPSRTVGERRDANFEINEFPAFSFLQGDLHPHLLAFPLQLFVLTALLALLAAGGRGPPEGPAALVARIAVAAVGVGLLRATNSWDWPVYLALAAAAVALAGWRRSAMIAAPLPMRWRTGRRIALAVAFVGTLVVVQAVAAAPFASSFVTGVLELRLHHGTRTPLWAWLALHGWFVLVIGGWAWTLARDAGGLPPGPAHAGAVSQLLRWLRWGGIAGTVASGLAVLWRGTGEVEAIGLQLALVAWLAELFLRPRDGGIERTGLALAVAGFALALGVEFVVVGQDIGRMNTYFKFHLQAWMLLAIAAGVAAGCLVARGVPGRSGRVLAAAVCVASVVALAYLPFGSYGRVQTRFDAAAPLTLDGEAFLGDAVLDQDGTRLPLAADAALIAWLRANAGAADVVLEAQLPEYRWGSRISSFTGLPTVLGYRHHQTQQRPVAALGEAIELRRRNVAAIYASPDAGAAMAALQHYRVRYVVVGGLERASYPAPGIAKFTALAAAGSLAPVFVSGADVIYRVPDAAEARHRGSRW